MYLKLFRLNLSSLRVQICEGEITDTGIWMIIMDSSTHLHTHTFFNDHLIVCSLVAVLTFLNS